MEKAENLDSIVDAAPFTRVVQCFSPSDSLDLRQLNKKLNERIVPDSFRKWMLWAPCNHPDSKPSSFGLSLSNLTELDLLGI